MNDGWVRGVVKERKIFFVYGVGGGRFWVCFEKKGFCGQRKVEFLGGKRGDFTDCGKN